MSLLPVVVLDDPDQAAPLAEALLAGGIDRIEITLRTAAGLPGIREATAVAGMRVAAGSVVLPDQVDQVAAAGATSVVSPGLAPEVLARAHAFGLPVLPGVATPSEVMAALAHDIDEVKLFPAAQLGGPGFIKALAGPFPAMRFVPSGGVTEANAAEYLALPQVRTVSGSWVAPQALVAAGDWSRITELARAFTTRRT